MPKRPRPRLRQAAEAAEELGVARETTRGQLNVVFSKTDTHRQGELITRRPMRGILIAAVVGFAIVFLISHRPPARPLSAEEVARAAAHTIVDTEPTDAHGRTCDKVWTESIKCHCEWGGPAGDEAVRRKWIAENCKPEWIDFTRPRPVLGKP